MYIGRILFLLRDLIYLFYPDQCKACEQDLYRNEETLCASCRHELPLCDFHMDNGKNVKKVFYGRIPLQEAAALLVFEKGGLVQNLLHHLKYRGAQQVGAVLGVWLGSRLKALGKFQRIDTVIPVPLHPRRQRHRGYNQVDTFGRSLATILGASYADHLLIRIKDSPKQSKTKVRDRWLNSVDAFCVRNALMLEGCHVLLVDDVLTTGATLESCARILLEIPQLQISIATMAIAR